MDSSRGLRFLQPPSKPLSFSVSLLLSRQLISMSSYFAKRAICCSFFSSGSPRYHHLVPLIPLLRSPLSTGAHPQNDLPFIAQYLISSFHFSPDRALKYSAHPNLVAIKSLARPEEVVKFLSETGLSDAQIKAAVSFEPRLLSQNVEKTLKPKVRQLIDWGFSGEILVELIRRNPNILSSKYTLSNLLFWRDFVGNNYQTLLKIIQRNNLLFTYNIDQHVLPRINLFKECGLSNPDIVSLLLRGGYHVTRNSDSLRQTIEVIEELGVLRGSTIFLRALKAVGSCSKDLIKRKVDFLRNTYGWSHEDVKSAFRKYPTLLALSAEAVQLKMDFLVREAGFVPTSVASNPTLIGCSLERVLIPRHTVLCALEAKGPKKKCSLVAACVMPERSFREKYIVPFEKDIPGLVEAYEAAFGFKVPV